MRHLVAMALLVLLLARAAAAGEVRVVALAPRLDLGALAAVDGLERELDRIVGLAAPLRRADRPTLVLVPELWGLAGPLIGPAGQEARAAADLPALLDALERRHVPGFLAARLRFGALSPRRVLWLALADPLYRPLVRAASEAARHHGVFLAVPTLGPDVAGLRRFQSMFTFPERPVAPLGPEVYARTLVFDDHGRYVGETRQTQLSAWEANELDLTAATGPPAILDLPFGRIGVAQGDDARSPELLAALDQAGCQLVLAPAGEPGVWASEEVAGNWLPQSWQDALRAAVQGRTHLRAIVQARPLGHAYGFTWAGQGAIAVASASHGVRGFVGVRGGAPLQAVTPWVVDDPRDVHSSAGPATGLADVRAYLSKVALTLRPGRARAEALREQAIAVDLSLP